MTTPYVLRLDAFEGPLDLLLHLIRVHEIDIFKIDVLLLTTQYLNYLRMVKFRDLNQAAEFIQMAASLIEMKSRQLLPGTEEGLNQGEDGEDEDPAVVLQRRLLEYDKFRKAALFLSGGTQLGVQVQTSCEWQRLSPEYEHIVGPLKGDVATLIALFEQTLKDFAARKPPRIEAKTHRISVEETIELLSKYLEQVKFTLFQSMFHRFKDRYEYVANILAMLDLTKVGNLRTYQQKLMGPLWLYQAELEAQKLPFMKDALFLEEERMETTGEYQS